jgi:uncharacterized protein YdeI (BOF family)
MNIKRWTTAALIAAVLTAPAFADNDRKVGYDEKHYEYSNHSRYEWSLDPGQTILFKDPVSFEGEVTGVNSSHRMIKADNGMTIEVPIMALVWNGDTKMFAQDAQLGERVVIHMREEEPYRVMKRNGDEVVVGSYDGVYYLTEAFIADINLDDLDGDIYRDTADVDLNNDGEIQDDERNLRRYDNDLNSADN